jgi:hypothetical protein
MQQLVVIEKQKRFYVRNKETLSKDRDKFFICGTIVVEEVKVLYVMSYLFSGEGGEMHHPYQS